MKRHKLTGLTIMLTGGVAVGMTMFSTWNYGLESTNSLHLAAWNSLIDFAVLPAGIAFGALIAARQRLWALAAFPFVLIFLSVSIFNLVGASATSKMAVSTANKMSLDNKLATQDKTIEVWKQTIEKAMNTATASKGWKSRSENAANIAVALMDKAPTEAVSVSTKEAMTDAQAVVLASITGTTERNIQLYIAVAMAVALAALKIFSSVFGAMLFFGNNPPAPVAPKTVVKKRKPEVVTLSQEEIDDIELDEWLERNTVKVNGPVVMANELCAMFKADTGNDMPDDTFFKMMRKRLKKSEVTKRAKGMVYHLAKIEGPTVVKLKAA